MKTICRMVMFRSNFSPSAVMGALVASPLGVRVAWVTLSRLLAVFFKGDTGSLKDMALLMIWWMRRAMGGNPATRWDKTITFCCEVQ